MTASGRNAKFGLALVNYRKWRLFAVAALVAKEQWLMRTPKAPNAAPRTTTNFFRRGPA
jgi:hypothetical protein